MPETFSGRAQGHETPLSLPTEPDHSLMQTSWEGSPHPRKLPSGGDPCLEATGPPRRTAWLTTCRCMKAGKSGPVPTDLILANVSLASCTLQCFLGSSNGITEKHPACLGGQ